jgi:hypothetical protein
MAGSGFKARPEPDLCVEVGPSTIKILNVLLRLNASFPFDFKPD